MQKHELIYVAGHNGMVGSAVVKQLRAQGYENILTQDRSELNLLDPHQVRTFFESHKPAYVFHAAGKTGGIYANDNYRADFIYENLMVQCNVIHQAFLSETKKLLLFASGAMYPKLTPQPMKPEHLQIGPLEPTNEPFGIAKLAGFKLCESYNRQYGCDFITVIPANIYGVNQNYTPLNSLIIPALIARFHEAKRTAASEVTVWGSGRPPRDFIFADDVADGAIFLMNKYSDAAAINIGSGRDVTIREISEIIKEIVGYQGGLHFDTSKPDGALAKLLDAAPLNGMGWKPRVVLQEGIRLSYQDYLSKLP